MGKNWGWEEHFREEYFREDSILYSVLVMTFFKYIANFFSPAVL